MMDRLRESVNGVAIKIILGLIILSFVLAGVSSYLVGSGNNNAAKVGNKEITRTDFEQAYQSERSRLQSQMGDQFSALMGNPEYVKTLRQNVLDQLIQNKLIEQYATDLGLRASDKQVKDYLFSLPIFQTEGKFDQDKYQVFLRRTGYKPDDFAQALRYDLMTQQLNAALQDGSFVLPNESVLAQNLLSQKRQIKTLTIKPSSFESELSLTDKDLQSYYQAHKENFTRPEQFKYSYIELSAADLEKVIKISDEEAQKYYQENKDKYGAAKEIKVSHIMFKSDKAKAEAALKQLKEGADFADLAKNESEDKGSAKQGGDLGWISKGVMEPEFEKAAFVLTQKGDYTGIIKTDSGYHIIRLDDMRGGNTQAFSKVATQIKKDLALEKAVNQFYDLQTKLEKVAFESPDSLDDAAKAVSAKVKTTDFVTAKDAPSLLQEAAVQEALATGEVLEDGLNSEVIEVGDEHVVVVRIDDHRKQSVLPYTDVKKDVKVALMNEKTQKAASDLADELLASLNKKDLSILDKKGLTFGKEEAIDRNSPLARSVFAMPKPEKGQVVYTKTQDSKGNTIIIAFDKVEQDKSEPALVTQIDQALLRQISQSEQTSMLGQLREETKVKTYDTSGQ